MLLIKSHNRLFTGIGAVALLAQVGLAAAQDNALTVQEEGSEPVVTIDGETVTRDELTSFAIQLEQAEGARVPGGEPLLDEYILTELFEQIPTTATVSTSDAESTAPTTYSLISQRTLLKRKLRDWMSDRVEVPREALQEWYDQNVTKYQKPERIHAYHIFMETSDDTPSSSPEAVRSRLQELKTQIDSGTSFSQLAREHSEAASSESGGEIGRIFRRMPIGPLSKPMNLELENALFELQPGKVSDVVDTRHGMHLLYITDRQSTRTPTLDDMVTSGILPGAVAQDRLTSELRTLVAETVKKYDGQPLPNGAQNISAETVAFRFDGKDFTVGHLNALFGPRFTRYMESVQADPSSLQTLMSQALEDEGMVRAAVDNKIDQQADVKSDLEKLGQRERASKRINAIALAESQVTDEQVQQRYREMQEQLRQPEAEGYVIVIQSEQATGTAEQARAREEASKKAEDLRTKLEGGDVIALIKEIEADSDELTSVTRVPRHIVGQSTDTMHRVFDQASSRIREDSGLGDVMPMTSDYVIAYLEKRYPGEPIELEAVRDRIEAMLRGASQAQARSAMVERLEEKGLVEYHPAAAEFGKTQAPDVENTTGTAELVPTGAADTGTTDTGTTETQ